MNLKEKLEQRLKGGKFRILNEKLYKNPKAKLSTKEVEVYHDGYTSQVKKWPKNPLNIIIKKIKSINEKISIADLGCGEAEIEKVFGKKHTVKSCDLNQTKKNVIKCDIESTPLENESSDIVVLCLSLMKKNCYKSIVEANRICKTDGILYIAEVTSRIDDLTNFVESVEKIGFSKHFIDTKNKFFVLMEFKKTKNHDMKDKIAIPLNPCVYKRR